MTLSIEEKLKEYKVKFNEVLHRMYNLEIIPEIQSRINERIPESGGFMLFENEELENWLRSALSHMRTETLEQAKGLLVKHSYMTEKEIQDTVILNKMNVDYWEVKEENEKRVNAYNQAIEDISTVLAHMKEEHV